MVRLRTRIVGGVSRESVTIDSKVEAYRHTTVSEVTKIVEWPEEHAEATLIRNQARGMITKWVSSSFLVGDMCELENEEAITQASVEARDLIENFNSGSRYSRIELVFGMYTVAGSQAASIESLREELKDLLEAMENGIGSLNPMAIRAAAKKAKTLSEVLDKDQAKEIDEAIQLARSAATEIVRRVEKDGEDAAEVLSGIEVEGLKTARFSFLDHSDLEEVEVDIPSVSYQRFANAGDDADLASVEVGKQAGRGDVEMMAADASGVVTGPAARQIEVDAKVDVLAAKRAELVAGRRIMSAQSNSNGSETIIVIDSDGEPVVLRFDDAL